MKRTIQFRAWDKISKEMYSNGFEISQSGRPILHKYFWEKEPDLVLLQFTGLLDKNGKEIYEGDIVKGRWLEGTIVWSDGYYGWSVANGSMFKRDFEDVEVIGNIYENPELVER